MNIELSQLMDRIKQHKQIPLNSGVKRRLVDDFLHSIIIELRNQAIPDEYITEYQQGLILRSSEPAQNRLNWALLCLEKISALQTTPTQKANSTTVSQSPIILSNIEGPIYINYSGIQTVDQSRIAQTDFSQNLTVIAMPNFSQLEKDIQVALDQKLIDATDAQTIQVLANQLAEALKTQNKQLIQINASGLEKAATTIANIAPFVLTTAGLIIEFIRRNVGF